MFVVETDASESAIAATLSQNGRPVAFYSRTLSASECRHSSVEKEAYAVIEAVRKWRHFLLGRHFQLVTDQRSVSFMFDSKGHGKVKNEKTARWRVELACFSYDIVYRPGSENTVADAFSRSTCAASDSLDVLKNLHDSLCHPGVARMSHFVRTRNLPYSIEDVKKITSSCSICAECKPGFHSPPQVPLIKATQPFERLSVDFKGPLPTSTGKRYLLMVVDEFSRFPFAFPCANMTSGTVIDCLCQLFAIFGMPSYIHSARGSAFMSSELRQFLRSRGIACSRTTAFNPGGNG